MSQHLRLARDAGWIWSESCFSREFLALEMMNWSSLIGAPKPRNRRSSVPKKLAQTRKPTTATGERASSLSGGTSKQQLTNRRSDLRISSFHPSISPNMVAHRLGLAAVRSTFSSFSPSSVALLLAFTCNLANSLTTDAL